MRERTRRGHKYRLHLPAVKNVTPAGPELQGGLKLAQEVVAIEVGAAVHEHAIFGIEFPDRIASPVVVNENSLGLGAGLQERDSFLGKLLRLAGVLVAGKTDPFYQRKHSNQNYKGKVKKWSEPDRVWRQLTPPERGEAPSPHDRESRGDDRYRHQNKNWDMANGVQSGERGKEQGNEHTSLRSRARTGESGQKQQPYQ